LGERDHVTVRILDRELAHPVELRHERHHDLHGRLQPIVQGVDTALHLDEERPGRADRPAGERGILLDRRRVVEKISTGPLVTDAKTNGDSSGTAIPRERPSVST
jgi:hypothetical protein